MRRAVHALKYRADRSLVDFLVDLAFPHFGLADWNFDRLIPVPLGRRREAKRGYNQAALLAESISRKTRIPVEADCLIRSRETQSQVGLPSAERMKNVAGAFAAAVRPARSVLLVDDVCTTGATLQSCAAALRAAGAESVSALTLTRAVISGMEPNP